MPHPASLNSRRVKISKPEWQFMDVLPATQENCYQHRSNYGQISSYLSASHSTSLPEKNGRAGGIRTHDLLNPIQAHYQAVLRPDGKEAPRCGAIEGFSSRKSIVPQSASRVGRISARQRFAPPRNPDASMAPGLRISLASADHATPPLPVRPASKPPIRRLV
jgi:hypothetical protein